ncbi:phosphotransferase [Moritella sp. 24]|uniref:phosphotransferase n=1 Tax=Moritella sp. 24 TaxID=2746230 RepID=UPI001BAA1C09|nr:phosphotransferase [Moritella sp. 24]QUM77261.1 phosphotransferase [Moritella sp. 24]
MISPPDFVVHFSPVLFSLQPVSGGLSNHNYRLDFQKQGLDHRYFVRQFSATYNDMDNDVKHECAAQIQAANVGIAPNIIAQYEQGIICDWIAGKHWELIEQTEGCNIEKLAQLVANLHQQPVPEYHLDMTVRLQHYYQQLLPEFKTTALEQQLQLVVDLIEHKLARNRHGFCHHDMNPLNFIINEQAKLYLLDWEFAAAGHCDFDITTLFQTFAWQHPQKVLFLKYYNHYHSGAKVTLSQLDVMDVVVEMMTLLWCIVMYQQDRDSTYLTLWQQSDCAIKDKINRLRKDSKWDQ